MRKFVSENILIEECDLDAKEHDQTKFALDLIALTLVENRITDDENSDYIRRVLVTLDTLTAIYANNMSEMNTSVLLSLIQLMSRLDTQILSLSPSIDSSSTLLAKFYAQINTRIIASAPQFLDIDSSSPKSIYLRRDFKQFYLMQLCREPIEMSKLGELSSANLDIVCELVKHGLAEIRQPRPMLDK